MAKSDIRLQYSGFVIFAAKMLSVITGLMFQFIVAWSTTNEQYDIWFNDPPQFYKDVFKEDPYPYQARILREIKKLITTQRSSIRILFMAAGGTGKTKLLAAIAMYIGVVIAKVNTRISRMVLSLLRYIKPSFIDCSAFTVDFVTLLVSGRNHTNTVDTRYIAPTVK